MPDPKTAEMEAYLATIEANEVSQQPPTDEARFLFSDEAELVTELRSKVAIVEHGGQVRYLVLGNRNALNKRDAEVYFAPYQLQIERDDKPPILKPALPIYTRSPERLFYEGTVCVPGAGERVGNSLNTWRGFELEPGEGDWPLMRQHLKKYVCAGDEEHYRWVMSWMAQMLQDPANKMGSALVLVGDKGAGKTTLVDWLFKMVGPHHCHRVSNQRHVTGHFNKHLATNLLLNVDEATWGGDRAGEAILKDLITGTTLTIEGKGVDAVQAANFTRVLITSNPGWIIPATKGERRFFVLRVEMPFAELPEAEANEARRGYFEALRAEYEGEGPAAMMRDLMQWEWRQTDLRKPPVTEALAEQMAQTFSSAEEWLITVLSAGGFVDANCQLIPDGELNLDEHTNIATALIVESYRQFVRAYDGRGASPHRILKFLREFGEVIKTRMTVGTARPWGYRLAPLREWRQAVSEKLKVDFEIAAAELIPMRARERLA